MKGRDIEGGKKLIYQGRDVEGWNTRKDYKDGTHGRTIRKEEYKDGWKEGR
jgi:hypothetical protein